MLLTNTATDGDINPVRAENLRGSNGKKAERWNRVGRITRQRKPRERRRRGTNVERKRKYSSNEKEVRLIKPTNKCGSGITGRRFHVFCSRRCFVFADPSRSLGKRRTSNIPQVLIRFNLNTRPREYRRSPRHLIKFSINHAIVTQRHSYPPLIPGRAETDV